MAVSAVSSSLSPARHTPDSQTSLSSRERPSLPVDVRAARLADVPLLIGMKTQMAAAEDAAFFFDDTPARWERDFFGPESRFLALVSELAGHPVGMAIFNEQPMAGWPSVPIYIQSIYVKPEFRRRGVGRALMAGIIAEAQRRRSQLVFLNVDHNNAARRLYESGGFVHADTCLVYTLVVPQDADTPQPAPARR
ncbi:GNAT family N-acetyltransferase [Rhodoplanes sp. Z2-YC6860]|uniref:GNAT family N-acetyltransferase n=1 Tax=Rhodoplanes sp. Z2-YC6860 TaxID=674703 RepID=UPI00078DD6D4|nr:GNAT family N-acetyltransferase [Rhodoplanes sp. Z2-YC6860]AMN44796.1 spermidine/spermine N-acetyltransferase [Rhodoplanes sp. Z2-YC6860]